MTIEQPTSAHPLEYTGPFSDEAYRDRVNGWRRRFTLTGECLIVQARHFSGSEYESRVSLHDIDPLYSVVRNRNLNSIYYTALAVFVFIVLVVLAPFTQNKPRIIQAVITWPMLVAAGFTLLD